MGQNLSTGNYSPYILEIPSMGTFQGSQIMNPRTGNITVKRFCQVPYAYPCEGPTRFTLPKELPKDFDYTGDYTEMGLKCPQPAVANPHFRYFKSPSKEFIQYNNIFVPASDKHKPADGWPVLFYIHGGWLQYNSPNNDSFNVAEFFDDEEFKEKFILVVPGYRLNMFGFLSSRELLEENPKNSNFGFWDQRLALEWTYKHIPKFGGNPEKITVGGISAGSYSTFFQLAYELYNPHITQIIKQAAFFSNLVYIQPKSVDETQEQFDEIIQRLNIPYSCASAEKLRRLRELDTDFIEDFIPTLDLHTFRAVTDDYFISPEIIKDLYTGKFGALGKEKGVRILNGEVDNECLKYSLLNTPKTIEELPVQVENYYPKVVIPTLLDLYEANIQDFEGFVGKELDEQLRIKYGAIIGEGQVYASSRGFLNNLVEAGFPESDIFRYKISFRAKWLDEHLEKDWKVPHAGDFTVWFFNMHKGYTDCERKAVNAWLQPYVKFLNFESRIEEWPTENVRRIRLFNTDGTSEMIEDDDWEWGVKVANAIYEVQI